MARPRHKLSDARKEELWLFLGITAVAVITGLLTGWLLLCLLTGLLAYLARHVLQLLRLPRLIAGRHPPGRPRPYGIWKEIFHELEILNRDSQQHEDRLSQLQNQFQEALSALPDAVIILGPQGHVEWMNPAAEQLLGVDYPRLPRPLLQDLVRDPNLEEYLRNKTFDQPLVFSPPENKSRIVSLNVMT